MAPRKKTTAAKSKEAVAPPPVEKETITITLEVERKLYNQVCNATKLFGFSSVDEFLLDAIRDKV